MSSATPLRIAGAVIVIAAIAAAVLWWTSARGPAVVSAEEALGRACAELDATDSYDVTATVDGTVDGRPYIEVYPDTTFFVHFMRVSGNDYHTTMTEENDDTVVIEHIRVGNVLYLRERGYADDGGPGDWKEWRRRDVEAGPPLLQYLGDNPLCPDLANLTVRSEGTFNALGDDLVDGVSTLHFSDGGRLGPVGRVDDPEAQGTVSEKFDFWVDQDSGQLVQVVTEAHYRNQRFQEGPPENLKARWEIKFSGIGEPNVITAPTLPAQ